MEGGGGSSKICRIWFKFMQQCTGKIEEILLIFNVFGYVRVCMREDSEQSSRPTNMEHQPTHGYIFMRGQKHPEGLEHTCTHACTQEHTPFQALGSSPQVVTPTVWVAPPRCHAAPLPAGGDTCTYCKYSCLSQGCILSFHAFVLHIYVCDLLFQYSFISCVCVCVLPWRVLQLSVPAQLPPLAVSQLSSWSEPTSVPPSPASPAAAALFPRSDTQKHIEVKRWVNISFTREV